MSKRVTESQTLKKTVWQQFLTSQDYIFSLLTGYCDPPAGVTVEENQHYNPYFAGQKIGMAQALYNEIIEYEDGKTKRETSLRNRAFLFCRTVVLNHFSTTTPFKVIVILFQTPLTVNKLQKQMYSTADLLTKLTVLGGRVRARAPPETLSTPPRLIRTTTVVEPFSAISKATCARGVTGPSPSSCRDPGDTEPTRQGHQHLPALGLRAPA